VGGGGREQRQGNGKRHGAKGSPHRSYNDVPPARLRWRKITLTILPGVRRLAFLLLIAGCLLAGCGGDDDTESVENLLDRSPPLSVGTLSGWTGTTHSNSNFDQIGRRYTVGLRYDF
jgi:hypothetical protein